MQNESLLLILPGVGILALCLVVVIYRTGTKETTANTHEEDNPLFNVSRSTSSASLGEEEGEGEGLLNRNRSGSDDPYAFRGGGSRRKHRKSNKGSKGRNASKGSKGRKSRKHNNKKSKSKNSKSF
jgi:hypothetical protein